MVAFCLVSAFLALVIGALSLSNATMGVGGIGAACFWAILARIAQAQAQHAQLVALAANPVTSPQKSSQSAPVQPVPLPQPTPQTPTNATSASAPASASAPLPRKLTAVLPGTGRGYFVEAVGESFNQPALRALAAAAGKNPIRVLLQPEPDNPHDANAVAVKDFEGQLLGYLSRDDAPRYQQTLLALRDRGQTGVCSAVTFGGDSEKPNIGIRLDLEAPMHIASSLGVDYTRVSGSRGVRSTTDASQGT